MTQAEAARAAGYSKRSAKSLGHKMLKSIAERMPEVLERMGYQDEKLITKYLEPLLRAKDTKFFAHKGKVRDRRDVADNDIRLKALDTVFRLKGSYAAVQQEQQVTHTLTTADIEDACNIAERISKMRVIDLEPLDDGDASSDENPHW